MPEILRLADRVIAMYQGRVMRAFTAGEVNEDNLVQAISGIGNVKAA
jgi:ribose transport system ATP-binding protein